MVHKAIEVALSPVEVRNAEASQPSLDLDELPEKNTFIDFPAPPMARPPTPTASAPAFLDRFKNRTPLQRTRHNKATKTALQCEECSNIFLPDSDFCRKCGEPRPEDMKHDSNLDCGSSTDCPPDSSAPEELAEEWLGLASTGSDGHSEGKCTPCAYYWKPAGCLSGESCGYCHLCPKGYRQAMKKAKVAMIRQAAFRKCDGILCDLQASGLQFQEPAYVTCEPECSLPLSPTFVATKTFPFTSMDAKSGHFVQGADGADVEVASDASLGVVKLLETTSWSKDDQEKYKANFIKTGFEDIHDVVEMTDEEVKEHIQMKPGHLKKWRRILEDYGAQEAQEKVQRSASEEKAVGVNLGPVKVSVKNTFIEFEIDEQCSGTRTSEPPLRSAPGNYFQRFFQTRDPKHPTTASESPELPLACPVPSADSSGAEVSMVISTPPAHELGQCTPCAYFCNKKDGCRKGADCEFCHLCQKGEIKRRKKNKVQQMKAAGAYIPGFSKMQREAIQ